MPQGGSAITGTGAGQAYKQRRGYCRCTIGHPLAPSEGGGVEVAGSQVPW